MRPSCQIQVDSRTRPVVKYRLAVSAFGRLCWCKRSIVAEVEPGRERGRLAGMLSVNGASWRGLLAGLPKSPMWPGRVTVPVAPW